MNTTVLSVLVDFLRMFKGDIADLCQQFTIEHEAIKNILPF